MVKCHFHTTDSFKHDTFLKPILTFEKLRQKNKSQKKSYIFVFKLPVCFSKVSECMSLILSE